MLGSNTNSTALTVLALTLACSPTPAWCADEDAAENGRIVFDFDRQAGDLPWRVINDGVMGGLSRGDASLSDESTLVFSGVLSLENRGGFSSIWSPPAVDDLGDSDVLVLRVRGDGRDYYVNLKNRGDSAAGSHRLLIRTQSDQWQIVSLPFDDFKYTRFGQQTPGSTPLDSSQIRQFGFTISDKKPGPFRLEVDWIKAATGQSGSVASDAPAAKDILETARAAGRFGTLLAAVDAAGLTDSLRGDGPLTVLAPTDEAFAKLPKQAVADLLLPENKAKLAALLSRHVLSGRFLLRTRELRAFSGSPLAVEVRGALTVGGATVLQADIVASNGLIHVIDTAAALGVSVGTIGREWRYIKAWLRAELSEEENPAGSAPGD